MSIDDFYNSTAVVKKVTTTTTNMGGVKKTSATRIASLPCRFTIRKPITETDTNGKLSVTQIWRLYCEASSTNKAIKESDIIEIDSNEYEITGINNPALLDRHLQIDLYRIY